VFRSLHNWVERGEAEASLGVIHKALKPGGRFCLSGHRGRSDIPQEKQAGTGYLRQDFAVAVVEKAGFRLVGSSEAKANPKDTKDHPAGVWTLPPSFRLKDQDREKYAAIGESDRFLLKFAKA
jgi:predicted methyltransferase